MVVLSIIGSLCAMASAVFPGAMQYFRARRSMESMMWDLRRVQAMARSRGHAGAGATLDPARYGFILYQGTTRFDGSALVKDPTGYSYLAYAREQNVPDTDIAGLTPAQRAQVVNLDASLIPVRDATQSVAPRALPGQIQFTRDVTLGQGDIIPADPSMVNCAGCPTFMDFYLQNGDGYFRIQFEHLRFIGLRYVAL